MTSYRSCKVMQGSDATFARMLWCATGVLLAISPDKGAVRETSLLDT